jgi:hypothetical protein
VSNRCLTLGVTPAAASSIKELKKSVEITFAAWSFSPE